MDNEFDDDIKIDPDQLDLECVRQPELFWTWSKRAVEARAAKDQAEFEFEVTVAELQLRCRTNPSKFGLDERVTVDAVKAAVTASDDYSTAAKKLHRMTETSMLLDKAVAAMDIRKRMLETLVSLHGMQYFAGPEVPRNLGDIYMNQQRASDKRLNEKMRVKAKERRKKRRGDG